MLYVLMMWFIPGITIFGVTFPSKPVMQGGFLDPQSCNAAALSFIKTIKETGAPVTEVHVCVPNKITP